MSVPRTLSMHFRPAMVSVALLSTMAACAQRGGTDPGGNALKTVIDIPMP